MNGCHLLMQRYGIGRLAFGTLTLPALNEADREAVVGNWAEIIRIFNQRLRRHLLRRGCGGSLLWVTELQSERARSEGWLAPHIHLVFQSAVEKYKWLISPKQLREFWKDSVGRYCCGSYDWSQVENLQGVKKDPGQYLSKYLSKGIPEDFGTALGNFERFPFPSWYGLSDRLRRVIKKKILSGATSTWLLRQAIEEYLEYGDLSPFKWLKPIEVQVGGVKKIVAWCGQFTASGYRAHIEALDSLRGAHLHLNIANGLTG